MRKALLGCMAAALIWPGTAAAHSGSWYWSEGAAEDELVDYYSDVIDAGCDGYGSSIRRNRRRLYKHFDCYVDLDDGDTLDLVLHVRGKYRFYAQWL